MRLFSVFSTLAVVLPAVLSSPSALVGRQDASAIPDAPVYNTSNDMRLLNLALVLEHVMQGMYNQSFANYTAEDWTAAGYSPRTRERYAQMQEHENTHAQILTDAVVKGGGDVIGACSYKFPSTDVGDFVAVSEVVETMAVDTYNGMLEHIEDKEILTLVASIMNTKARHAAWIGTVKQLNPWGTAYEIPLSINGSFNVVGTYIIRGSCPKTNSLTLMLPIGVYDYANIHFGSTPTPGVSVPMTLQYQPYDLPSVLVGAFVTGTETYYAPVTQSVLDDGSAGLSVIVPKEVAGMGAVYVMLVQPDEEGKVSGDVDTETIYAGPTLVMFGYNSEGRSGGE